MGGHGGGGRRVPRGRVAGRAGGIALAARSREGQTTSSRAERGEEVAVVAVVGAGARRDVMNWEAGARANRSRCGVRLGCRVSGVGRRGGRRVGGSWRKGGKSVENEGGGAAKIICSLGRRSSR